MERLITNQEADILRHASNNDGRYVTTDAVPLDLAKRGLFEDRGKWDLAGGAHALALTSKGRDALNEWQKAQPKPKKPKRRQSPQFEAWRTYSELWGRVTFSEFLKEVWPNRRAYL